MIKKINLENIEYIVAVFGVVLYSGAVLTLFTTGGHSEGELELSDFTENGLIKQIFFGFYFVTFILLLMRWRLAVYVCSINIVLLAFTIIVFSSIKWSILPNLTLTRAIALLGTHFFSIFLATRYTLKQQLSILYHSFGVIVFSSLLIIILLPKYGIMTGIHSGAWRGVFNHKNVLGKSMVLSTVIFYLQSVGRYHLNLNTYVGLLLSIVLVIASRSSSSLINLVIVTIVFLILKIWRWRYELMIPASLAIILIGTGFLLWFHDNSSLLFSSVGKSADLSGRADIWNYAWNIALKQPLLGYGYGAFWKVDNQAAVDIWRQINWEAPNAHNGFLDLFLSLGIVGVFIVALSFINTLIRSFIWLRNTKTPEEFWLIIFMVYLILSNYTESALMLQNDLFTVIYVTISYTVIINNNSKARAIVYRKTS